MSTRDLDKTAKLISTCDLELGFKSRPAELESKHVKLSALLKLPYLSLGEYIDTVG